jgi:putative transcription factor
MQCELCGKECDCRAADVDGVRMMLCPSCMKHGKVIADINTYSPKIDRKSSHIVKKPVMKDVYKDMNKELVNNWNIIIKNAREKRKLTREELGFKIGERTVTIAKIENGDLRPSDIIATKLEKELKISLFERVADINTKISSGKTHTFTIGDFIKREE